MQVNVKTFFETLEQIFEIIDSQVFMMPALHQDLSSADGNHFLNFFGDAFERQDIGFVMAFVPVKRAE